MRPLSHLPLGSPGKRSLLTRAARDGSAAADLLGAAHPLVSLLRSLQIAVEQMLAVAAVQMIAGILLYRAAPFAIPLMIASGAVQLALCVRLTLLVQRRHELCLELIVEGASRLSLSVVELATRRLEEPGHVARLSRALDGMAAAAADPRGHFPGSGPMFSVRVVRPVAPQLVDLAALLRTEAPAVRGVALVEQLVSCGTSSLYGADVERLRRDLGRARYFLAH
jgi:hypothetical protein